MADPVRAREGAYLTDLEGGRTYFWCACGLSRKQPFCDGSHTEVDIEPLMFTPEETEEAAELCGCKLTKAPPLIAMAASLGVAAMSNNAN